MAYDGSIKFDTKIDDKGFKQGMSSLGGAAKAGAKVAAAAIAGISVAFVGAGVAAVKFGAEFETSIAKASTLFGDVQVNVDGLKDKMLGLSNSTGVAASELGNSLYNALSAGIPVTEDMGASLAYMEDCTKLAKAGFTDVDTAVTATAKVLNAYKMDVSETGDVHKVLMQVQNKGITTVGELGSVLAQVTPTAAAMNVAFEQVGASLATMTAQGTPAAQATTQLNSMFAELGKSGMQAQKMLVAAAEGTQYAGMSFQDMMQKGVPLNEVLGLMDEYAKKNNKSLLDMFGSIEAGKAALAMSGQNAAQYASNLEAMGTSADVVGDAYEKVTDTLEAKTQEMGNSFKNLGIQVYEKFETPLKEGAKVAIGSLSGLSSELNSGKLSGSLDKIAASTGQFLGKAAELASQVIPKLVNGLSFVIDHGRQTTAVVGAAVAAIVTFKAVSVLGPIVKSWQAAAVVVKSYTVAMVANNAVSVTGRSVGILLASTMTAQQLVVGVLTGKVAFATAAQVAWNAAMTANPIGLVIAGVAALTVGIAILGSKESEEEVQSRKLAAAVRDQSESWKELKEAQQEQIDTSMAEIDHTERLWKELQMLVDENGNVVGSKERVKFITDELNKLAPESIGWIDGERLAIEGGIGAIDRLIEKKRAQAALEASEAGYKEAIKEKNEALKNAAELEEQMLEQQKKIDAEYANMNTMRDTNQRLASEQKIADMQRELDTIKGNYNQAEENLMGHIGQIDYYEKLQAAISSENYAEMTRLANEMAGNWKSSKDMTVDALKQQAVEIQGQLDYLNQIFPEGANAAADSFRAALSGRLDEINAEIGVKGTETAGAITASMGDGLDNDAPFLNRKTKDIVNNSLTAGKAEGEAKAPAVGKAAIDGVGAGAETGKISLANKFKDVISNAIERAKRFLEVNSPSKLVKRVLGRPMGEGLSEGLGEEEVNVSYAMKEVINNAIGKAVKYVNEAKKLGVAATENLAIGLEVKKSKVYEAVKNISEEALKEAKKKGRSYKEIGSLYGQYLTKGITESTEKSVEAIKELVEGNVKALAKTNPKTKATFEKEGRQIIEVYTKAIKESSTNASKEVVAAIQLICDEAQDKYNEILRAKESLESKLADFGDLYTTDDETGEITLSNIHDQIDATQNYYDMLEKLKEKLAKDGLSEDFLKVVTNMNMEQGTKYMETLLSSTDASFGTYVSAWEEKQKLAKEIASKFYADELDALEKDFVGKLEKELAQVPATVENVGKSAIQGFINGMESKRELATATAKSIADAVKATLQSGFEINSPSKWAKRVIGQNVILGMGEGMTEEMQTLFGKMQRTIDYETNKLSIGTTAKANYESKKDTGASITTNDNGVKQTVIFNKGVESPADHARAIKKAGRDLVKV